MFEPTPPASTTTSCKSSYFLFARELLCSDEKILHRLDHFLRAWYHSTAIEAYLRSSANLPSEDRWRLPFVYSPTNRCLEVESKAFFLAFTVEILSFRRGDGEKTRRRGKDVGLPTAPARTASHSRSEFCCLSHSLFYFFHLHSQRSTSAEILQMCSSEAPFPLHQFSLAPRIADARFWLPC